MANPQSSSGRSLGVHCGQVRGRHGLPYQVRSDCDRGKGDQWANRLLRALHWVRRCWYKSRIGQHHQPPRSRSTCLPVRSMRCSGRNLGGSYGPWQVVDYEKLPKGLPESLGCRSVRGRNQHGISWRRSESAKQTKNQRKRTSNEEAAGSREGKKAEGSIKKEEARGRACRYPCERRPSWEGPGERCPENEVELFKRETDWRSTGIEGGRYRSGRVSGWCRPHRRIRLCCGEDSEEECFGNRIKSQPKRVKAGSARPRRAGGFKRKYFEEILASEEREEGEEGCGSEEDEEQEILFAGNSRATRGRGQEEEGELAEEKRKISLVRGKGIGSVACREEKEGQGKRWGQQPLQQWILDGWRHGGRGVVIRERSDRSSKEEVAKASGIHLEDAGFSCNKGIGSISSGGNGQQRLSNRRDENGYVFQPAGETQLQPGKPRFEGDASAGDLYRSTSKWAAETSGRLSQCQVCGPPLRCGGRLVGGCEASGTSPLRASAISANGGAFESKETCQIDPAEPGRRRRLLPIKGWRLMEFLERRRRLARWRIRKRKGRKRKGWSERKRKRQWMEAERMERLERQESRLVEEPEGDKGCKSREGEGSKEWLAGAEPTDYDGGEEAPKWREGFRDFRRIAENGRSLKEIGCMLCWLVLAATSEAERRRFSRGVWSILSGLNAGSSAVHRLPKKGVFPIRLGGLASMVEEFHKRKFSEIREPCFVELWAEDAWLFNSIQVMNYLHGCRAMVNRRWRVLDEQAVASLRHSVKRTLAQDTLVDRTAGEVQKELSCRFVSYSGEEIPKMEILTVAQVQPALPPIDHGGCIPVVEWLKGRTRTFMNFPSDCICPDTGQPLPKLQARVHIAEGDKLELCELLCERGVCTWVEESEVFRYRGQRVLNGMFGVPKSSTPCRRPPVPQVHYEPHSEQCHYGAAGRMCPGLAGDNTVSEHLTCRRRDHSDVSEWHGVCFLLISAPRSLASLPVL